MTQEDKDLLLKDLCARLPYEVKVNYSDVACTIDSIGNDAEILLLGEDGEWYPKLEEGLFVSIEKCKPFLYPLSSMTEEEIKEYKHLVAFSGSSHGAADFTDWLNAHHFDYRGLIEKGLAIDCTNLNVY